MALKTDLTDDADDLSKYAGTLFGNRHIHHWLLHHMHLLPDRLIECFTQDVEVSRAGDRGIILPKVLQKAIMNAGHSGHFPKSSAWPPAAGAKPLRTPTLKR